MFARQLHAALAARPEEASVEDIQDPNFIGVLYLTKSNI